MSRPVRRILILAGIPVLLLSAAAALLYVPVPESVLTRWITANAGSLVPNPTAEPAGDRRSAWDKLRAGYAHHALASRLAAGAAEGLTAADDAQAMAVTLLRVKSLVLNQAELSHQPQAWTSLVSGLGYCDQLNAAAATVLAQQFGRAQLVAITDPVAGGHTVGRVWSRSRGEWLYFDLWAEVVVFQADSARALRMLVDTNPYPGALDASRDDRLRLYAAATHGSVFNEYRPAFGSYVLRRALRFRRERAAADAAAAAAASGAAGTAGFVPRAIKIGPAPAHARALYARARIEHILGRPAAARELYRQVVHEAPGSFVADAATQFLARSGS